MSFMTRHMPLAPVIRVAVLDDHEVVLRGVTQELANSPDIQTIGAASSTADFMSLLRAQTCDIALIDFTLSEHDLDGLNLIRLLRARFPNTRIIVFSAQGSAPTIDLSIRAGAYGFFPKSQPLSNLAYAIRTVHRGRLYLPHGALPPFNGLHMHAPGTKTGSAESCEPSGITDALKLSPREQEVVRCCLEGLSLADTARKFSRSIKTVTNQRRAAFCKLGIRTLAELFKIRDQLGR